MMIINQSTVANIVWLTIQIGQSPWNGRNRYGLKKKKILVCYLIKGKIQLCPPPFRKSSENIKALVSELISHHLSMLCSNFHQTLLNSKLLILCSWYRSHYFAK